MPSPRACLLICARDSPPAEEARRAEEEIERLKRQVENQREMLQHAAERSAQMKCTDELLGLLDKTSQEAELVDYHRRVMEYEASEGAAPPAQVSESYQGAALPNLFAYFFSVVRGY